MEIAVIGREDFCLGFRLAGIKKIFETEDPTQAIHDAGSDEHTGIVIFDDNLTHKLDNDEKQHLENSLKPI